MQLHRPHPADGGRGPGLLVWLATLRHVRPGQALHRARMLWRRGVLYRLGPVTARYARGATGEEPVRPLGFPRRRPRLPPLEELAQGTFTFVNRRRCLGQPVNWLPSGEHQLWLYNLHYFDHAPALAWAHAKEGHPAAWPVLRDLVSQWIERCPVGAPIAWDPYPTSVRIANWLRAYALLGPELAADPAFARALRRSLYAQASFLERNLEYHLLGNHLLENGRALLLAGLFFSTGRAARWQAKGRKILWLGLEEQFLADGGHEERSPMYHQLMLELYQEVAAVLEARGERAPSILAARLPAMRRWLAEVVHPDGGLSLFNDAAFGVAPPPAETLGGRIEQSDGLVALPASGYFVFRDRAEQRFLILDCGPIGPDHQPGHGHCDTLSFELSLAGERIVVDSGVGTYYGDPHRREYYRSTRAHNTVAVDGAEQSEIWAVFRVGRRARPLDVRRGDEGRSLAWVAGSHSGYRRLPGGILHRRWVCWVDRRFWVVCDRVSGRGSHRVESFLHFHPDVRTVAPPTAGAAARPAEVAGRRSVLRVVPWGFDRVETVAGGTAPLQGWYAPEFGVHLENPTWTFSAAGDLPVWTGYVLWPEAVDVLLDFTVADGQRGRLAVRAAGRTWILLFGPLDLELESGA